MKEFNNDLKSIFAKNLKNKRKEQKLTQAEFASKIGLSASFITEIENGRKAPSFANIEKIAEVLNAPPWSFFYENGNLVTQKIDDKELFSFELKNALNLSIDEFLKDKLK